METKDLFKKGDIVICKNAGLLHGNDKGPALELEKEYTVRAIQLDKNNNQHLDVGLVSHLSYVTSYETKENLIDGDKIHWCHPSRFVKK